VSRSSDVDIIEQYLNGDVKINFADLNVSGHIQRPLPLDNRRYSFAGSSTTEGIRNRDKEIDALLADAARMKGKTMKELGMTLQIPRFLKHFIQPNLILLMEKMMTVDPFPPLLQT
jgi:hypothetical protein